MDEAKDKTMKGNEMKTFEDLEKFKAAYTGNPNDLILLRCGEIIVYPAEEAKTFHSVTVTKDQIDKWAKSKLK